MKKRILFFFIAGFILGIICFIAIYQISVYFSTNESCMICHVHPHVEASWKLSTHVNNRSGVTVNCIDCHLPPKNQTVNHYTAKAKLGLKDLWGYLVKDSADFNWDMKSELEHAVNLFRTNRVRNVTGIFFRPACRTMALRRIYTTKIMKRN